MDKKDRVKLAALGVLGVLSAALDFAAESAHLKLGRGSPWNNCVVISGSFAPYFEGFAAGVILLITRMIIHRLTRGNNPLPQSITLCCLSFLSWWIFIGAEIFHLVLLYNYDFKCAVPRRGAWAGGGILGLASVAFGTAYSYYHLFLAANFNNVPQSEIAMGQINPSTVAQDPALVHEDTSA